MSSQSKKNLSCTYCYNIYRNPVVLPCGHSFCDDCVKKWWEGKETRKCPDCNRECGIHPPPSNVALKTVCEAFLQEGGQDTPRGPEVLCNLHNKKLQLFCVNHQEPVCVDCRASDEHNEHDFKPIDEAAKDLREELRRSVKTLQERLKLSLQAKENCVITEEHIEEQVEKTEREIKEEFKNFRQLLKEEEEVRISALKREKEQKIEKIETLNRETAALSDTIRVTEDELRADDVSFLQNYKAAVNRVQQRPLLEDPQQVSGALIDEAKHLGNLSSNIWNKMKEVVSYTPVILDPNTAHPELVLSQDLTSVSWSDLRFQTIPDNPERFDVGKFVLGSEGWDSGSHSWVVSVCRSYCWSVGVAAESFRRRGSNDLTSGLWALTCRGPADGNKYQIIPTLKPPAFIPVQGTLRRVRVDLDLDEGRLLLSDDDTDAQIHTFTHTFTEKMFPVFMCGSEFLAIVPESSDEIGGIDVNEIRRRYLQYSKQRRLASSRRVPPSHRWNN